MSPPGAPGRRARPRRPARPRPSTSPATEADTAPPLVHRLVTLQRTIGNAATTELIVLRHKVAGTDVHRHKRPELFDPPGTTLAEFEASLQVQADWFAEGSLTPADRTDLHALLRRTQEGPHIMAGVGDLTLTELRGVAAADWPALAEYGRGRRNAGETVRMIDPAPRPLADRIALGNTLIAMKGVYPGPVLGRSVSEAQLLDVRTGGLVPALLAYKLMFSPNLEMEYEAAPGARNFEFQNMLDLIKGPGIAPFVPLLGRVRDIHRFPVPMLTTLIANFADTSRKRPVHLILHGSRDAAGAFQQSAGLFASLVADTRSLHLMLEGAGSIADLTAAVPGIAATYGKLDKAGTPRIGQVMIAGHGEAQQVDLAQNDGMDINPANAPQRAKTQALLDALMQHMDPATARIVYAGCLVGSNPVAKGTPAADMAAQIAGNPNLASFTEQRFAAAGMTPGRTQAARASVALGASSSLMDASGNMGVQYGFDPNAYADASTYVATGHEPEGLFRSAVELATSSGPVVAETQLRARLTAGADPAKGWFDQTIMAGLNVVLAGVAPGAGVPAETLNTMTHMIGPPFLVGNGDGHGRNSLTLVNDVNSQPLAGALYAQLGAQGLFVAPNSPQAQNARFMIEQGWLNAGGARAAALIAWLDGTVAATTGWLGTRLDTGVVQAVSAALFPAAAAATSGRIRLALTWLQHDPGNADVRAFLLGQVERPAAGPKLSAVVHAELGGIAEDEVLSALGVIATAGPPGAELPAANAQVRLTHGNEVRIEPLHYQATVIPAGLNVRTLPGMHGRPFEIVHAGDPLDVSGFTHDWAAVDRNGRLGYVLRTKITPP